MTGCRSPRTYACAVSRPGAAGLTMPAKDPGERVLLAEREERFQQPARVQHLDAARVQPERTDVADRFLGPFQQEHAHPLEPQLGRQHEAGRSATDDEDVAHEISLPVVTDDVVRRRDRPPAGNSQAAPGSCRKPPPPR